MRLSVALVLSLLSTPALAHEPPAFAPDTRLHIVGDVSLPMQEPQAALAEADVRIFAVVTDVATDARYRNHGWGSETEAALERTWSAWSTDPRFDAAEDVLIFVALEEREVRIRTGSTWDTTFELHNEELTAITEKHFVPLAKAGNLPGALARTIQATDRVFSAYAAMPPTLPRPSEARVAVWPAEPLMPQVRQPERVGVQVDPPVTVHIAQYLPEASAPGRVASELLGDDPDHVVAVWDVRDREIGVAFGESWREVMPSSTPTVIEGVEPTTAAVGEALKDLIAPLAQRVVDTRMQARRDFWLNPDDGGPVRADPADLSLPTTRAMLDRLDWPVAITVVEHADASRETTAPDGRRWVDVVASESLRTAADDGVLDRASHAGVVLTLVGDPPQLDVHHSPFVPVGERDIAWPSSLSIRERRGVDLDSRVAGVLQDIDVALKVRVARKEAEEAAEAEAREARARTARTVFAAGGGAGTLGLLGLGYGMVVLGRRRRRQLFESELAHIEDRITAARERLVDFRLDTETRQQVRLLRQLGPITRQLQDEVTSALDEIEVGVRALEARITEVRARIPGGSTDPDPRVWTQALDALHAPLEVEPDAVDDDLFAPLEQARMIPVDTFMAGLVDRFATARAGWQEILDATRARFRRLEDDLDRHSLDEVVEKLAAAGLSPRWRGVHPYEIRAADLPRLDALRQQDPVDYLRKLAALQDEAGDIIGLLTRLPAERDERDAARSAALPLLDKALATVCRPEDDPRATAARARALDAEADAMLAATSDPDATIAALDAATAAWEQVKAQHEALVHAIAVASSRVEASAAVALDTAADTLDGYAARLTELTRDHSGLDRLTALAAAAREDLEQGRAALDQARSALADRRHLDAIRLAEVVLKEAVESGEDAVALFRGIEKREQAELEARALLARLDDERAKLRRAWKPYDSYGHDAFQDGDARRKELARMTADRTLVDWVVALELARATRKSWTRGVDETKERYRAAKAAEAARAAAAEARRRARASSSYSSSSSWGSSSSSSSSSSWSSSSGGSSWSSSSGSSRSGGSSWSSSSSSSSHGSGRSGGSSW